MSKASYQAYEEMKPKAVSIETQIYQYLENTSGKKLASILSDLKLKHQTATSRLSSLHDEGRVVINGNGEYRTTFAWEMEGVVRQRAKEKKVKWLKKGVKNGWIVNGTIADE